MRKLIATLPADEDPHTLSAALHSLALSHLPSRFYLSLQLAVPAAVQFWASGWPRSSALMIAVSSFGIWALSEQALDEGAATMGNGAPSRLLRVVHWVSGVLSGGLTAVLTMDLMLRFFGLVFRCPGCAG